ncbi:hypothetical protein [Alkalimarinus sediminis]|uniref:Uncharacterized protein n=1 Tax=Alkalimarinus sediminis TaxID=1632866 RepID=A0A9E8KQT4_9ALTE|nr:hypothetical protein [Alkalimarinus sediminis]UZW75530.1 hypothetical protein NNL22_02735 [Alkalimarinus sediminis]
MQFSSVNEAIRVLRIGTKNERWFEAASFLIDRASPEVKLMLEVGRELEKKERADGEKRSSTFPVKQWVIVLLGITVIAGSAGYIGWLITRSVGLSCG